MKKEINIIILLFLCFSCNKNADKGQENYFSIDKKKGILFLNFDLLDLKGVHLNQIILSKNNINLKQRILLDDSSFMIRKIENVINSPVKSGYVNTVSAFDGEGNFVFEDSYFYETRLQMEGENVFLLCLFLTSKFKKDKFILDGSLSSTFDFDLNKSEIDTIRFDDSNVAKIPIKNWKIGKNNRRFIIVDQHEVNDTIIRRLIYVDKDFYIRSQ